ncbi:MAG: hypothetical protein U0793_18505 [Gemmataceae bacterium]
MRTIIQVSKKDNAKAWGILVRHSPGQALPDRTFVLSDAAVQGLREAGVRFRSYLLQLCTMSMEPSAVKD